MKALLLSAGLGTRFRPHTDKLPKPALPFLNIPLLGYSLFYLEQLGVQTVVANTHHLPAEVERALRDLAKNQKYKLAFSHEPKILGSGGGIKQAQSHLSGANEFIVANADEVLLFAHTRGLAPLVEFHRQQGALATLLTTDHPEAGRTLGGVWVEPGASGRITRLGGTHADLGAKHFTGVYVFSPRVFDYMPSGGEFHIFKDCLHKAMAAGEKVLSFHDPALTWLDMSSEKDFLASTKKALEMLGAAQGAGSTSSLAQFGPRLEEIISRFTPEMKAVEPGLWLGSNTRCEATRKPGAIVYMGANSHIGTAVEIKGFIVFGNAASFTQGYLENAVLGADLRVHPLETLRNQFILN